MNITHKFYALTLAATVFISTPLRCKDEITPEVQSEKTSALNPDDKTEKTNGCSDGGLIFLTICFGMGYLVRTLQYPITTTATITFSPEFIQELAIAIKNASVQALDTTPLYL